MLNGDGGYSLLALALVSLFDKTDYFSRKEWARFFGIEESVLNEWTTDKGIPHASCLNMSLDMLGERSEVPIELTALLTKPATEITPHLEILGSSLQSYLENNSLEEFGGRLKLLDQEDMARALLTRTWYPKQTLEV